MKENSKYPKRRRRLKTVVAVILSIVLAIGLALIIFNLVWPRISSSSRQSFITNNFIAKNSKITDAVIEFQSSDGKVLFATEKGSMTKDSEFAVASISKIYTHALIFQLIDEKKLSDDDKLKDVMDETDFRGLQIQGGKDVSGDLTIRQLIDQTSGLADYETNKLPDGRVLIDEVLKSDVGVDYDEALRLNRELAPHAAPGKSAYYSNMNALLLGRVAERITKKSLNDIYKEKIFEPLSLKKTRVATVPDTYTDIYINKQAIQRPKYIATGLAAGGIVSTNSELMTFTKAFFGGKLFNKNHIEAPVFKPIQFPMVRYGSGIHEH